MKEIRLNDGSKLIITEANKNDATSMIFYLAQISSETDYLTFGLGELNISIEEEEKIIEDSSSAENKLMLVAQIGGQIVGCLNFRGGDRPRNRHTGEFGISVLKEFWGRGIGTELLNYCSDWAGSSNIVRKINLRVRADNTTAIALYTRYGFKKEGEVSRDLHIKGNFYTSILMGLEIN